MKILLIICLFGVSAFGCPFDTGLVYGRVMAGEKGLPRVRLSVEGVNHSYLANTNPFGFYSVEVNGCESYTIYATSKSNAFDPVSFHLPTPSGPEIEVNIFAK